MEPEITARLQLLEGRMAALVDGQFAMNVDLDMVRASVNQALRKPNYVSPRIPYYSVYSTDPQTLTGTAWTKLTLANAVERKNKTGFAISTGEVTLPSYGEYRVYARVSVDAGGTTLVEHSHVLKMAICTNAGGTFFAPEARCSGTCSYPTSPTDAIDNTTQTLIVEHPLSWPATSASDTDFELVDGKFDVRAYVSGSVQAYRVVGVEIIVQRIGNT